MQPTSGLPLTGIGQAFNLYLMSIRVMPFSNLQTIVLFEIEVW